MTIPEDPYSRLDYRRLIAWPQRIERERPFLLKVLGAAPVRRLLDLGCGTGEHSRFLAAEGFEVVGVDHSASMLEKARAAAVPDSAGSAGPLRFVQGDFADLGALDLGTFGGAICLGNALPHVREDSRLLRAFEGLRASLLPGSPLLLQILNYDHIVTSGQRHLPLNFRRQPALEGDGDEEVVFLRLMDPRPDGSVIFNPTTLRYRPGQEPPVEVVTTKNVYLRGWRRQELEDLLEKAGFRHRQAFGGMQEEPFEANSSDLVLLAR